MPASLFPIHTLYIFNYFHTVSMCITVSALNTFSESCKSVQPFSRNVADKEISIAASRGLPDDPKCNQVVPWSVHTFPENFMQIGPAVLPGCKTSQTTDRQTTCCTCTKGATDSTVGQKCCPPIAVTVDYSRHLAVSLSSMPSTFRFFCGYWLTILCYKCHVCMFTNIVVER